MTESIKRIELDPEVADDFLYAARAGDLDLLKTLLAELPPNTDAAAAVLSARDEHTGNTPIHYAAANGHTAILQHLLDSTIKATGTSSGTESTSTTATASPAYILEIVGVPNDAENTPLHYAAINGQLESAKALVETLSEKTEESKSARMELLQKRNARGHDAAFEAEVADKEAVVTWLLERMDALEPAVVPEEEEGNGEGPASKDDGEYTDKVGEALDKVDLNDG